MLLNELQESAVKNSYDTDVALIAGAGSGKSTVLAKRVEYIIANRLAEPKHILVLVFGKKAAADIREKIESESGMEASMVEIGTFHSFCTKILRKYGHYIGIDQKMKFYDSNSGSGGNRRLQALIAVLNDLGIAYDSDDIRDYFDFIDLSRANLITPSDLYKDIKKKLENGEQVSRRDVINYKVYSEYQKRCWKFMEFDYTDIVIYTYVLLRKCKDVRKEVVDELDYILIDEAQDLNIAQITIIKLLKCNNNNIMLIGDYRQAIFGFLGSKPSILLNHKKLFPGSETMFLKENYRSTKRIVSAANNLIKHLRSKMENSDMVSNNELGKRIELHKCIDCTDEADFICGKIFELTINGTYDYKDIAIIYPQSFLISKTKKTLSDLQIPFVSTSESKFFNKEEIKKIISCFKFINDPSSEQHFRAVTKSIQGLGKVSVDKIVQYSELNSISYTEALKLFNHKNKEQLQEIAVLLENEDNKNIYDIAKSFIGTLKIIEKYKSKNTDANEVRIENVRELLSILKTNEEMSIKEFLDFIALNDVNSDGPTNAVNFISIHSSKGLEYKVVFLMGFEDGAIPFFKAKENSEQMEESLRLAYVAITRAKKELYISFPAKRLNASGNFQPKAPSPFLKFIGNDINFINHCKKNN